MKMMEQVQWRVGQQQRVIVAMVLSLVIFSSLPTNEGATNRNDGKVSSLPAWPHVTKMASKTFCGAFCSYWAAAFHTRGKSTCVLDLSSQTVATPSFPNMSVQGVLTSSEDHGGFLLLLIFSQTDIGSCIYTGGDFLQREVLSASQ